MSNYTVELKGKERDDYITKRFSKMQSNFMECESVYKDKKFTFISAGNQKIKPDKARQFSLPCRVTCPGAGECKNFCYAGGGFYKMDNVSVKHWENFRRSKNTPDFIRDIIGEILRMRTCAAIRIHDAGDFYNLEYLQAWIEIARACPDMVFYAYTKSLPLIKEAGLVTGWNDNLFIRYSLGGRHDDTINLEVDHHSRVFATREEGIEAGYTMCPDNSDAIAHDKEVIKLGLVIHGELASQFTG